MAVRISRSRLPMPGGEPMVLCSRIVSCSTAIVYIANKIQSDMIILGTREAGVKIGTPKSGVPRARSLQLARMRLSHVHSFFTNMSLAVALFMLGWAIFAFSGFCRLLFFGGGQRKHNGHSATQRYSR